MKKLVKRLGWPGTFALAVILIFVLVALLAPWIAPYPLQGAGGPNVAAKLSPPSADYWLGTDHLGRDILSRIVYGTRVSLTNGMLIVAFSLLIGLPIGLAAGYFGGWIDEALMRGTDVFLAFPALLLAVLMAAALGPGFLNSVIAVAVTWWPWYARLARAEVLVLRGQPYVEAAQARRLALAHHPAPHPAGNRQAADGAGSPRCRTSASDRRRSLLPRPWRIAADCRLGPDGRRWKKVLPRALVVFCDAGPDHLRYRARLQRARRCAS